MTAAERMAAGWQECWGAYLQTGDRKPCWWTGQSADGGRGWERADQLTKPRRAFAGAHDAMRWCLEIPSQNVTPRRFWRRKKPKAPPPLKGGDEVMVRAKVAELGTGQRYLEVCVQACTYERKVWVYRGDIVR